MYTSNKKQENRRLRSMPFFDLNMDFFVKIWSHEMIKKPFDLEIVLYSFVHYFQSFGHQSMVG